MNSRLNFPLFVVLLLLFGATALLAACNSSGSLGDDDDEIITPPDDDDDDDDAADDDDDDDDDDAVGPPSLSFDPSEASAGDVVWVNATWKNFELTQQTTICCTTEGLTTFQAGQVSGNSVPLLLFFGLHTDGELEWGLNNGQGDEVVGSFDVTPLGDIPVITPGIETTSASIEEDGGFNVFEIEVEEPFTIVTARANNLGDDEFHPWFLAVAEDGYTALAGHGYYNAEQQQQPFVSFVAQEAGTFYIRIQDNAQLGGHTYGYDLDLGFTQASLPTETEEIEPNDAAPNFQDLGVLVPGGILITGTAETAGHAGNNDLNGDLDVFTFTLDGDSLVHFSLDWKTGDDFDAVLYDYNSGDIELGFGSPDAISTDMASVEQPERVTLELEAGAYALQVGNWKGSPGAAYGMSVWVMPSHVTP